MRVTDRAVTLFKALNPLVCKFLTTSQIVDLWGCKTPWEANHAKRYLRKLYGAGYLERPIQQRYSPNVGYKDLVYERTDKAARAVDEPNILAHRSNSYPHELITDFCFAYPALHWAKHVPGFKLTSTLELMSGHVIETREGKKQIPEATRHRDDPFKLGDVRFDYTPVLFETDTNLVFIPGIQTDRNSENLKPGKDPKRTTLVGHIDELVQLHKSKAFEKRYGFSRVMIPLLCTNNTHLENAKRYVYEKYGPLKYLLFKYVPDIAYLDHFPEIAIDPVYERVEQPSFNLQTLMEVA